MAGLVPAIHANTARLILALGPFDAFTETAMWRSFVDGRHKAGHDGGRKVSSETPHDSAPEPYRPNWMKISYRPLLSVIPA